jgi:hypothetical protein
MGVFVFIIARTGMYKFIEMTFLGLPNFDTRLINIQHSKKNITFRYILFKSEGLLMRSKYISTMYYILS